MKTLSLRYEDKEHQKLKTAKDKTNLSWERFFLSLVKGGLEYGNSKNNRS